MPNTNTAFKSVLITGAAGFIGQALARVLKTSGHYVVGLDKVIPDDKSSFNVWIQCDLTSDADVNRAIDELAQNSPVPVSVVHLAAYYDFSGAESPLYDELTVEGTRRLLRALQSIAVQQFIFTSTILAMREQSEDSELITESSPTHAEWLYPESKLDAEQAIREERGAIPAVILRIAGVYDDDCHSIPLAHQIARIYERDFESHFFPGDEDNGQPFIHIDDLVACMTSVLRRSAELEPFETFIVGEPENVSYGRLQNIIGRALYGKNWLTVRVPKVAAKAGAWLKDKITRDDEFIQPWMIDIADANYPISIGQARAKLGWEPRYSLEEKVTVMVDRLKEDPERWYIENKLPLNQLPDDQHKQSRIRPEEASSNLGLH